MEPQKDSPLRTGSFWARVVTIYGGYKITQLQAALMKARGATTEEIERVWTDRHSQAGAQMHDLCISLRGFFLKAGQFIGSRGDFVPEQICKKLSLLCDKVPPMSADKARAVIERELGLRDLGELFEWIELEQPLGSASVAQVHKAKLRQFTRQELHSSTARRAGVERFLEYRMAPGESAWDICNRHGLSLADLQRANKGMNLDRLKAGHTLRVPLYTSLESFTRSSSSSSSSGSDSSSSSDSGNGSTTSSSSSKPPAVAAAMHAARTKQLPKDGLVAVKVQYPNALPTMAADLKNLRAVAFYLSKTELKFDLLSAVDELNKQIRLEFDFVREARVMDTIHQHLRPVSRRIEVPRSVPGLVTPRLLVMSFLQGTPLTEASKKVSELSPRKRAAAKRLILKRVSEAYGRMILGEGLFQADGHPGNILIAGGGNVGLLDYGQSKQLSDHQRVALAELVLELHKGDAARISRSLADMGVATERDDAGIRTEMAYGMFDTRGKVDPFDPNSPIKRCGISEFPSDFFFVLRVVQLLRGLANGMGVDNFSSADQWVPFARETLRRARAEAHWSRGLRHFLSVPLLGNLAVSF